MAAHRVIVKVQIYNNEAWTTSIGKKLFQKC